MDDTFDRILSGFFETNPQMTVEMCLSLCRFHNYPYAGLEFKNECYCGHEPDAGFNNRWTWSNKCFLHCPGNPTQNCGGIGAISIWSTIPDELNGLCVNDYPHDGRVLSDFSITGIQDLTVEYCGDLCHSKGQEQNIFLIKKLIVEYYYFFNLLILE